jgi:Sulfotransferase domain
MLSRWGRRKSPRSPAEICCWTFPLRDEKRGHTTESRRSGLRKSKLVANGSPLSAICRNRSYAALTLKPGRVWTDCARCEGFAAPQSLVLGTLPAASCRHHYQHASQMRNDLDAADRCSLVFQDSEARPLNVVSRWIDGRAGRTEETHHAIEAQKHRRFLKSHTPLDGLPLHDGVRYIFVGRDGRDALMSLHFTSRPGAPVPQPHVRRWGGGRWGMTSKSPENPIRRVRWSAFDRPHASPPQRCHHLRSTSRFAPAIRTRTIARIRSISAVRRPCVVRALRMRSSPSAVRGPVLVPPCILHFPQAIAGALQGMPVLVRAPHRGEA